jgi:hypothetical protein
MDDSDLAGPILFFLLFGTFLLFVSIRSLMEEYLLMVETVWQSTFRLHIRRCPSWQHLSAHNPITHVSSCNIAGSACCT